MAPAGAGCGRAMRKRRPAEGSGDGAALDRWLTYGPLTQGRPRVLVHRGDRSRVVVGAGVSFGDDVEVLVGGNHRMDWVAAYGVREILELPGAYEGSPWSAGDIEIGDRVTIGRGTRILSGVTIGDGAVVLPYSIVISDVASGSVVGGHPARPVAYPAGGATTEEATVSQQQRTPGIALAMRVRGRGARILRRTAERLDRTTLAPMPPAPNPPTQPQSVTLGTASYFEPIIRAAPDAGAQVVIGNYASVSYECECDFVTADPRSVGSAGPVRSTVDPSAGPNARIVFGSDVWVARGTKVMAGVTVGDGAVVAGYSVVTGDVRPYAIVAGNPAREVGRRFDDASVEALLRIRWWDWTPQQVRSRAQELCSTDVAGFVRRYDPQSGQSTP